MKRKLQLFFLLLLSFVFVVIVSFNIFCSYDLSSSSSWNIVAFQINWPEGESPHWYVDPLLAKEVFSSIIEAHQNNIPLWRFHRRAVRDRAGHQFSFIFYADQRLAKKIFKETKENLVLKELLRDKIVIKEKYLLTGKCGVGDLSDPHWSREMQIAWPDYAMGFSKLWLNLIFLYDNFGERPEIKEKTKKYQKIQNNLNQEWGKSARHAIFHHVHAIFAYQKFN